jgi:uncharacterized protein (DUF1697 family)
MSRHIALLRAINVVGRNKVAMADLRAMFESLGHTGAQTLLQSGNVVFEANGRKTTGMERLFENECEKRLKLRVDVVVRTAPEWRSLVTRNPFLAEVVNDPGHLLVMCLKERPAAGRVAALRGAIKGRERIEGSGRELYIHYIDGVGTSKLTTALIEKVLETRGTARNWNTVLKLKAIACD